MSKEGHRSEADYRRGWDIKAHAAALEQSREVGRLGMAAAQEVLQPRAVQWARSAYRRVLSAVRAVPGAVDRAEQALYRAVSRLPEL